MPMRCLIVDDDPGLLRAAGALLEREGISVVGVASTSDEAVRAVERLRPDVTLVDVDLGEESGLDLAWRLAHGPPAARSTAILISAYPAADLADLVEASPAAGFVSKTDLSAGAIHALLQQHRATGAGATETPETR
jgi:DNA-binding NarL/FixJ family response regulator